MIVALGAVLGAVIGSFLNVVIWRVPRGESLVSPPSRCVHCARSVRPLENIPVLSWLALGGKCRGCEGRISVRYPLVEATTASLFAGVAALWGLGWHLPLLWYFAAIGIALALIDLDVRRLPDAIVLPSLAVVLVLVVLAAWNPGQGSDWSVLVRAVIGAAAFFAVYFLILFAYPQGMGFGDVKLAAVLGMVLGWSGVAALVVGFFAPFFLGGLFALGAMARGRAHRKSQLPFGPWMVLGTAVALVWAEPLASWYLGIVGV